MNLRVFIPTVGEPFTLETIRRVKAAVPEHKLTVWYEVLDGIRDNRFLVELRLLCGDVIVSQTNHGIIPVINAGMLATAWDYFFLVLADQWLEPDSWNKLYGPHEQNRNVACSGGWRGPMAAPLVWGAPGFPDTYPDGPLLISRKAVDESGYLSPSFRGHGHGFFEWHERMQAAGWKEAIVDKVFTEQGTWHEGRDKNPNAKDEIDASDKVLARCRLKGFLAYDWWRSDL